MNDSSTDKPKWIIDDDGDAAVLPPVYIAGVTITPVAMRGEPIQFIVESSTPDEPLSRSSLASLGMSILVLLDMLGPDWGKTRDKTPLVDPAEIIEIKDRIAMWTDGDGYGNYDATAMEVAIADIRTLLAAIEADNA